MKILWKMEHLLFWSKCSIFHNIFKCIHISKASKAIIMEERVNPMTLIQSWLSISLNLSLFFVILTTLLLGIFQFFCLLGISLGHSQGSLLLGCGVLNLGNLGTTWELLLYCRWRCWTVVVLWILVTIANVYILKFPEICQILDWLQSLKQFFINASFHILVASLTLMALF